LRSVLSGSTWSRFRLWHHKRCESPKCLACGHPEGTLHHAAFDCPAQAALRLHACPEHVVKAAAVVRRQGLGAGELFARGLFPDPESLIPRHPVPETSLVQWWRKPASGLMTGCLFLDGSALRPHWRATRRAGWAIVQVDRFGNPTAAAFGPVPFDLAPAQTSKDGEDFAVYMATVLTYGECDAYIDCASTVGGCSDPLGSTKASSPRAHLWGRIHAAMDFEQFKVHKTKGHATAADLDRGTSTRWEQLGNNGADKYAKLGAAAHFVSTHDADFVDGLRHLVRDTLVWVGRVHRALTSAVYEEAPEAMTPFEDTRLEVIDDEGKVLRGALRVLFTPPLLGP
jgi:hypothetical protein